MELEKIKSYNPNSNGVRYSGAIFMGEIVNMISFCTREMGIDAIDVHIMMAVAYYSTISGDLSKIELDFDKDIDPNIKHGVINAKSIHISLNMPRETVRRRLIYLESIGYIKKVRSGYVWPTQVGNDDKTGNVRKYFVKLLDNRLMNGRVHTI